MERLAKSHFMAVFLVLLLTACAEESSPIPIGLSVGWSGPSADMGREARDGVSLAIEIVNSQGGVHGHQLELLVRDDGSTPESALQADRELIEAGVVVIIGHLLSAMSMATVPQVNEEKVLMLSPTTSTSQLSGLDDYFLRINESVSNESTAMASYAYETLGSRNVIIVYNLSNRAFTEDYGSHFKQQFLKMGGAVSAELTYESNSDLDFMRLDNEVLKYSHDLVLMLGPALEVARLSQQLRKKGDQTRFMTSVWATSSDLITTGGKAVEGLVTSSAFNRNNDDDDYVAFRHAFVKRFHYEPNFSAVMAYESMNIIIQVMHNIGGDALQDDQVSSLLRQEILARKEFHGVQGPIVFDKHGDVKRKICIVEVRDGAFVAMDQ